MFLTQCLTIFWSKMEENENCFIDQIEQLDCPNYKFTNFDFSSFNKTFKVSSLIMGSDYLTQVNKFKHVYWTLSVFKLSFLIELNVKSNFNVIQLILVCKVYIELISKHNNICHMSKKIEIIYLARQIIKRATKNLILDSSFWLIGTQM